MGHAYGLANLHFFGLIRKLPFDGHWYLGGELAQKRFLANGRAQTNCVRPLKLVARLVVAYAVITTDTASKIESLKAIAGSADGRAGDEARLGQAVGKDDFVRAEGAGILVEGNEVKRVTDAEGVVFGERSTE